MKDCELCGGTHYGSFTCPYQCDTCSVNTEPCDRPGCARNARYKVENDAIDARSANAARANLFKVGDYKEGYPVFRGTVPVATFVCEDEAVEYAAHRNKLLAENNTTDVSAKNAITVGRQLLMDCRQAAAYWSVLWLGRASAASQKGFRFPDGREPTAVEVSETFDQAEKASSLVKHLDSAIKGA